MRLRKIELLLPVKTKREDQFFNEFRPGRDPKWEFVYDEYTEIPVIQVCIETKLTKKQLWRLLPDPYGISYSGLPFRTVFASMPWYWFGIRFDMKTYSRNRENSWNTGEWLATRGKRIVDFE